MNTAEENRVMTPRSRQSLPTGGAGQPAKANLSGCRITASMSAFQAEDEGSIPSTRTKNETIPLWYLFIFQYGCGIERECQECASRKYPLANGFRESASASSRFRPCELRFRQFSPGTLRGCFRAKRFPYGRTRKFVIIKLPSGLGEIPYRR